MSDFSNSPPQIPANQESPRPISHNGRTVKAVVITAVCSLVVAGVLFLVFYKLAMARKRRRRERFDSSFRRDDSVVSHQEWRPQGRTLKGVIVDENGLDVLYVRKYGSGQLMRCFSKVWVNPMEEEDEEKRIAARGHDRHAPATPTTAKIQELPLLNEWTRTTMETEPPPSPPLQQPKKQTPPPPPPPPPPIRKPHRPPFLPATTAKRKPTPPPPPPRTVSALKPPPAPRGKNSSNSKGEAQSGEKAKETMKLKPLHWDKVTANVDHSMVWDEINDGSFRFDDDLMETLFGYNTANHKSPEIHKSTSSSSSNPPLPSPIFILEPRKSQNKAIVLKSLAVSRKEIIDAVLEGRGLTSDILEKLAKISPTKEEESKILQFSGNPTKLADAESFLYHILRVVPSAFVRVNAMLFQSNYDPEVLHLKESLQILELSCKELRTRGIFYKLLEAILKAGNRLNAGTARGNAQGFNLSALRKVSSVKSTNGKTTLLHFVVEEVARSEGKRIALNQNSAQGKEEKHNESLMLGLSAVGSLSIEFSNVKKAAIIDYDSFTNSSSNLTTQVAEISQLVMSCGDGERGGFVREMKRFLEESKEELKVVKEEQVRVMDLVKRTTAYYQAGASKDKGADTLQLFAIVKDFLNMVDQVCLDIRNKLQKRNVPSSGSSPPLSPTPMSPVRFQNLQSYFGPDKPGTTDSSESDDDF